MMRAQATHPRKTHLISIGKKGDFLSSSEKSQNTSGLALKALVQRAEGGLRLTKM
jgi:hypothetical protein